MRRGVRRRYESPRRRQQAEDTRKRLAASARRLFSTHGYGATTVEAIARDAGVAIPTFYAVYGSKRAVLFALLDEIEAEADLPALTHRLRESEADPRQQVHHMVDFSVRLFAGAQDVLEIARSAGSAEADATSLWRNGEERRRVGQVHVVRAWAERGVLKPGLTERAAADILWALTGPDMFRLLATERGWSVGRVRDWLAESLVVLLFGESTTGA
jgi:AcrR family transcriptional regulator